MSLASHHPRQHSAEAEEPQSSSGAVILIITALNKSSNKSLTQLIALEFSALYMVSLSTIAFLSPSPSAL